MKFTKLSKIYMYTLDVIPTGMTSLEDVMYGFEPGELYVITGRPGMGKTSLMLQMALNIAQNTDYLNQVYIYSLEQSAEQLAENLSASVYHDAIISLLHPGGGPASANAVKEGERIISRLPIYICDDPSYQVNDICEFCERVKDGILFIDYLQLLNLSPFENSKEDTNSRTKEIELIIRMLSNAARLRNIPIVLLSQIGRWVDERTDKRPRVSDLRWVNNQSQIERIITLYRPHYYYPECDSNTDENIVEISVFNSNEVKIGTVEYLWDPIRRRFKEKNDI